MKVKIGYIIIIILVITNISSCKLSPEEKLSNLNKVTGDSNINQDYVLVNEVIKGDFSEIRINMPVETYREKKFTIYETDILDVDFAEWKKYLFPDSEADTLIHFFDSMSKEELTKIGVSEKDKSTVFCYSEMKEEQDTINMAQYYNNDSNNNFLYVHFDAHGMQYDIGKMGYLRRENQVLIPIDSIKRDENEKTAYHFLEELFGSTFINEFDESFSGFREVSYMSYEKNNEESQVYLVTYDRKIDNVPILFDDMAVSDGFYSSKRPDTLEVFLEDGSIFYARGMVRKLTPKKQIEVISPSEALNILKVYFETIDVVGLININRFEIMYYPNCVDDDKMTYESINGENVEYTPVWVIASGERYLVDNMKDNSEFVFIINAQTGETIKPQKR